MNIPTKAKGHSQPKTSKEAQERENWYKLVVKITKWKEVEFSGVDSLAKVSQKEWVTYTRQLVKVNSSVEKEKTLERLAEIKDRIQKNNGFEEII